MAALQKFLFEHRGHPLVFDENCESELGEWEEVEPDPSNHDPAPLRLHSQN
jgi:hypothetical protein